MELFYKKERDRDFFEACESVRKEFGAGYISVSDIAKKAIHKEAKSFYLDTREYVKIAYKVGKENDLTWLKQKDKKELYLEIYKRYMQIFAKNPKLNRMDIARIIAEQKAPRFYISEVSASNLYYKLLKNRP